MATRFDPRMHAYDEQSRHSGMIYILMLVIALAFGGFLWQLYRTPGVPRITAPSGPYKIEPRVETPPDVVESGEALTVSEAMDDGAQPAAPASEAASEQLGPPQLAPEPRFVTNGPYVAQLAALQSEAAVEPAWRRFSSRAPGLFASARLDVERADLGPRGIYYRVRAGYFADRAEAARFCERIRQMGQDCIPTAR